MGNPTLSNSNKASRTRKSPTSSQPTIRRLLSKNAMTPLTGSTPTRPPKKTNSNIRKKNSKKLRIQSCPNSTNNKEGNPEECPEVCPAVVCQDNTTPTPTPDQLQDQPSKKSINLFPDLINHRLFL